MLSFIILINKINDPSSLAKIFSTTKVVGIIFEYISNT
jgi:hypothetical protein